MTWNELKPLIEDDFLSRQLKDPSIRLRALDNIEALLKVHMPELLNDILAICNIEKKEFKKKIERDFYIIRKIGRAFSAVSL